MALLGLVTHIPAQVSKDIPTFLGIRDYFNIGQIDTSPNFKGYPNISKDMGHLVLSTHCYKSKYQRITEHILGHGTTCT